MASHTEENMPTNLYLNWKIKGAKQLNAVEADIGRGSDLMGIVHQEMENQLKINSRSWRARVLHLRSTEKYELDRNALKRSVIARWEEMAFENLLGVLRISSYSTRRKLQYSRFRTLAGESAVPLPESHEQLDNLWLPLKKNLIPYKLDHKVTIKDNRVALKNFDNPLTFLCQKHNIVLSGIQKTYTLFGGPGSSSPSHYEDKHLGSINKMEEGLAIWLLIHYDDNQKLFTRLKEHLGEDCEALLASKQYIILPSLLEKWECRYYLLLQQPGDIVVTFPGAIHTVYNLQFTVKEALNFIPTRWIEPTIDHMDCFCVIARKIPPDMGSARPLEHGQSLAKVLPNSIILRSIEEWKSARYKNGGSFIGILDPMACRLPLLPKKLKMLAGRDFGKDRQAFDLANQSEQKLYCRVCVEDGLKTDAQALMPRSSFNRHVAEYHVANESTKWCQKCAQRFGDQTGLNKHKC